MDPNRKTTVLFADVIGAAKLSGAAGEAAAHEALTRCRDRLQGVASACGGRVIKGTGDKLIVVIGTPDAAADAAVAMHTAVDDLPAVGSTKLAAIPSTSPPSSSNRRRAARSSPPRRPRPR